MTLFADRLRQARQRVRSSSGQRMTQGDLASLVGVERNTVSRWENSGVRPKDPEVIAKLADVLRVSMEWLVGSGDEAGDAGAGAGRAARITEGAPPVYAPRTEPDPLLPLQVYQAVHAYRARLQAAGCTADQTQEAERLLLDGAQNRLRRVHPRARPVQVMLDDLEQVWTYIVHVLATEGVSV
jgi:transcriptional regulator with XRE-family HTH domain